MNAVDYRKKWLYHISPLENLAGILEAGGLWCKSELIERGVLSQSLAHDHLMVHRALKEVPGSAGGVLHDYVPFLFGPRSPMLCAIANGRVAGADQRQVLHLATTVENILNAELPFVFSSGHPLVAPSNFHHTLPEMARLDWPLFTAEYWNKTASDPDRPRRRQAEFLVHRFVPLHLLRGIGTHDETIARQVRAIFQEHNNTQIAVKAKPDWYYT